MIVPLHGRIPENVRWDVKQQCATKDDLRDGYVNQEDRCDEKGSDPLDTDGLIKVHITRTVLFITTLLLCSLCLVHFLSGMQATVE